MAWFSGLRTQRCHKLWCRSQMPLRSGIAVAGVWASSCSSKSTPSLGTSRCSPKKKKKRKKNEISSQQPSFTQHLSTLDEPTCWGGSDFPWLCLLLQLVLSPSKAPVTLLAGASQPPPLPTPGGGGGVPLPSPPPTLQGEVSLGLQTLLESLGWGWGKGGAAA